jgi:hypothetical protein
MSKIIDSKKFNNINDAYSYISPKLIKACEYGFIFGFYCIDEDCNILPPNKIAL